MHQVCIEDDAMYLVVDENRERVDCHVLVGPDEARRQTPSFALLVGGAVLIPACRAALLIWIARRISR